MSPDLVLQLDGVSLRFCRDTRRALRYGMSDIAAEFLPWRRGDRGHRTGEFFAVEDVSFTIAPGEAVALAGRNGAGKTTLLRMIAGLLKPDAGSIAIGGRVNPVIELGRGLNPQLTGRENARLGLVWRGTPLSATETLTEQIAEFAELGAIFETSVATYSAGMRTRLAFAIAAHVPCELMLLDEVLAVGDIAFRQKCMRFMLNYLESGGALLLVSHDPGQMQHVCRRGLVLEQGRLIQDSPIADAIDSVFKMQANPSRDSVEYPVERVLPRILAVDPLAEMEGAPILSGKRLAIRIRYFLPESADVRCVCQIWTRDMAVCIAILADDLVRHLPAGEGEVICYIPGLPLVRGQYAIRASLVDPELLVGIAEWGQERAPALLEVDEPVTRETMLRQNLGQVLHLPCRWTGGVSSPQSVRLIDEVAAPAKECHHVG